MKRKMIRSNECSFDLRWRQCTLYHIWPSREFARGKTVLYTLAMLGGVVSIM